MNFRLSPLGLTELADKKNDVLIIVELEIILLFLSDMLFLSKTAAVKANVIHKIGLRTQDLVILERQIIGK